MWLFLTVPLADLQCVVVVFPDHTHLHFDRNVPYMTLFNNCSNSFSMLHI